ncbi:Hypothetical predicted protein, partial [Paramuricea clavata]
MAKTKGRIRPVDSGNSVNQGTSKSNSDNEMGSQVDVLVEKYGQGEVSVRKCETCEFEQTVRTAGAHVNGDEGSVMVFTDDDEFICPNCMMNTPAEKDTCTVPANDDKIDEKEETYEEEGSLKQPSSVPKPIPKKRRKTNMEKSLETVFKQFKDCADEDFSR